MYKKITTDTVLYLIKQGLNTNRDICKASDCKENAILYHLQKLQASKLIVKSKQGNKVFYHYVGDSEVEQLSKKRRDEFYILQRYNAILEALVTPMSIPQLSKVMKLDSRGTLTLPIKKLLDEKYVVIDGIDNTSNKYKVFNIYRTVVSPYEPQRVEKAASFGSDFLNKMFGVNTVEPSTGRVVKEKNVKQPLKKSKNYGASGSSLSNFI